MTQDYAFLVPLLGLNYPVFKALQWALNHTSLFLTHRIQKFIDFLRRNYLVEQAAHGTFKYWRIQGKRINFTLITDYSGYAALTIYFDTDEFLSDVCVLSVFEKFRIIWSTRFDGEDKFSYAQNGLGSLVYFGKQDFFDQLYQRLASS